MLVCAHHNNVTGSNQATAIGEAEVSKYPEVMRTQRSLCVFAAACECGGKKRDRITGFPTSECLGSHSTWKVITRFSNLKSTRALHPANFRGLCRRWVTLLHCARTKRGILRHILHHRAPIFSCLLRPLSATRSLWILIS